jgi:hypothetical protein
MTNLPLFRLSRPSLPAHVAFVLGLFCAPTARASPEFPGEVQERLAMPCVPQCTLCHLDTNGGKGTVVQPFGQAMMAVGLVGNHVETVDVALVTLEQASSDSDADGAADVAELREGKNPNQAGEGVLCATYGCRTERRPPAGSGAVATLVFLLMAAYAGRRRKRAHAKGASR